MASVLGEVFMQVSKGLPWFLNASLLNRSGACILQRLGRLRSRDAMLKSRPLKGLLQHAGCRPAKEYSARKSQWRVFCVKVI